MRALRLKSEQFLQIRAQIGDRQGRVYRILTPSGAHGAIVGDRTIDLGLTPQATRFRPSGAFRIAS
jgi:hypothetical protein